MRLLAIELSLLAVALLAPSAHSTSIAIPVPPEKQLDDFRLPRDVSSLIKYLEFGIPPNHVPLVHPSHKTARLVFYRFNYYDHTIDALAKLDDPRAVPVLKTIQSGRLAPVLHADLELAIAANESLSTWDDWRLHEAIGKARLALRATVAIELIAGESQVAFLRSMLKESARRLMRSRENPYPEYGLLALHAEIAEETLKSGSTAGVDSMIQLLNSPDPDVREMAARKLREWTNQPIGPYEDSPETTLWSDVQQWQMWWAVSRRSVNPMSLLPKPNEFPKPPPAKTLPDRLRNSILRHPDYGYANDDREWVYVHAGEILDELRVIALDPHERHGIRAEALGLVVYEDRNGAIDLAISCLQDESGGFRLYSAAVNIVRGYRGRAAPVLRQCIAENWPAATVAIHRVAQDEVLRPLLLDLLPTLTGDFRDSAMHDLLSLENPPQIVIELALAGDEVHFAREAIRKVELRGTEARLSTEARRNLERWKSDPDLDYWNLPWMTGPEDKKTKYVRMMASKDPSDPRAASFFARAMREVGGQEASDGFVRCVEYYRELQGRGWTLADLGYK